MLWEEVGWFWQTISVSVTSALPTSYQHSSPASPGAWRPVIREGGRRCQGVHGAGLPSAGKFLSHYDQPEYSKS